MTDGFQVQSVVTPLAGGRGSWWPGCSRPIRASTTSMRRCSPPFGTKIGGEIITNDALPGMKEEPDIIGLAGGGFVVAWSQSGAEQTGDGNLSSGSRAQLFDAAGNKVGFRLLAQHHRSRRSSKTRIWPRCPAADSSRLGRTTAAHSAALRIPIEGCGCGFFDAAGAIVVRPSRDKSAAGQRGHIQGFAERRERWG